MQTQTNPTDKYTQMAAIAGKTGGLDEKQWPGLAIILRSLARDTIEECAKVADQVMEARAKGNEFVEPGHAIRSLKSVPMDKKKKG